MRPAHPTTLTLFFVVGLCSCAASPGGSDSGADGGAAGAAGGSGGGGAGGGSAGMGGAGGLGGGAASGGAGGGLTCQPWEGAVPDGGTSGGCPTMSPGPLGAAEVIADGGSFVWHFNKTYGTRGGRVLQGDLLIPRRAPDAGRPGILLTIHGGGWQDCNRRRFAGWFHGPPYVIDGGFAAFNIEYRLVQEGGGYPENLKDVKCAVKWLREHADAYGLDATRIISDGESAGGHLSLMLAVTGHRADLDPSECGTASSAVQGAVSYSGVGDVYAVDTTGATVGVGTNYAAPCTTPLTSCDVGRSCNRCNDASPQAHVCAPGVPPVLIVHAPETYDTLVLTSQGRNLHAAFRDAGVNATLAIAPIPSLIDGGCLANQPAGTFQAHGWVPCLERATFDEVMAFIRPRLAPQ